MKKNHSRLFEDFNRATENLRVALENIHDELDIDGAIKTEIIFCTVIPLRNHEEYLSILK